MIGYTAEMNYIFVFLLFLSCQEGYSVTDEEFQEMTYELELLKNKITKLEDARSTDEPVAFHTLLTTNDPISVGNIIPFNDVVYNAGEGYNPVTGIFTVPTDTDGPYYFGAFFNIAPDKGAIIEIQVNGVQVCAGYGDETGGNSDTPRAGCSAVVNAAGGDLVWVTYSAGNDAYPFYYNSLYLMHGFNGFKI